MAALGVFLILFSAIVFIAGLVALIRPLRRIGLGTRWRAIAAVVASCVVAVIAEPMLPAAAPVVPEDSQPDRSVEPHQTATTAAESVVVEPIKLRPCPAADPMRECEYDTTTATAEMASALQGDYQAQRNVSALQGSYRPWIVRQPVQSCAWATVARATRPPESVLNDESSVRAFCGDLTARDLAAARALASGIHRRIHGSDLPVA